MNDKTFSEVSCPLCKKVFKSKGSKPRTLRQWESSLFVHLIISSNHYLNAKEARSIVDSYSKKLESESPSSKQTTL